MPPILFHRNNEVSFITQQHLSCSGNKKIGINAAPIPCLTSSRRQFGAATKLTLVTLK